MIEFSWPFTEGEWFAWWAALSSIVIGLGLLLIPRRFIGWFVTKTVEESRFGLSEVRSAGGIRLGLGIGAILLAQPLIYLTFGLGLAFSVFGRLISDLFDKSSLKKSLILEIIEGLGAFFMIGYGLALFP